jgi:uncharacterized membrane protein (DUF2068 family)
MNGRLASLRAVAVFEASKGLLALVAAGALVRLLHGDVQAAAEDLVRHFHLNPAGRFPRVFLRAAELGGARLTLISAGALAYAAVRFTEAAGLWLGKTWARTLGIVSAGIYVPIELAELMRRVTWAGLVVTAVNVLILAVLWFAQVRRDETKNRCL